MKNIALMSLVCAIGATGYASDVTLVKAGESRAGIVLDEFKPTRAAQFAAYELQHVIKLVTGAELPIVNKAAAVNGVSFLVGESDATREMGIMSGDFQGEEYLVEFKNDRIILIGNDSPDYGKVDYSDFKTFPDIAYNYRSTTYAVYDFLEKCCGVRFYFFGDDGIAFERRSDLIVKPVSIRRSPKMDAFRRPCLYRHDQPLRDVQLLQLRWRVNTLFGEVNHNIQSIYYRYWGPAKGMERLFVEKRPEYFAQGYEGAFAPSGLRRQYPDDPDLPPQLCPAHPGTVEYFADEALKVYEGARAEGARVAGIPVMPGQPWYYPVQEDDSSCWCKCEKCRNSFADTAPELRYDYIHFDWINRIAAAAAARNPAIGISTLAYSDTLPYPDSEKLTLQPNIAVQICLGIQSWYHPGIYARQHLFYKNWVENEAAKRPLFVWVYMLCPAWDAKRIYKYDQFFPMLYPWSVARIFQEFAKDGIRGWFGEIEATFHMLEAYVANKICFDPAVDTDNLIDEYFTMYYGHAADPMRRFYRMIEDITWDIGNYPRNTLLNFRKNSFTYGLHTEKANWHLGTPERMAALQKIIDEAETLAADPLEKQRVAWFVDNIWRQAVAGRPAFEAREIVRAAPVPRVTVGYAGECDGKLEKVDFDEAASSGGWTLLDGNDLAIKPGLAFASDSGYFHIRYHETGDMALKHKDAGIWHNNVEIFLAAQQDYPYGQVVVAPGGEFKALRHVIVEGVVRMEDWPIKPAFTNRLDANGWTLTMAIPFANLLPDRTVAPGDQIYANFMRTRRFDGQSSWSWSPIFAEGYARSLYRMGKIYLAPLLQEGFLPVNGGFRPGDGALPDGWTLNQGEHAEGFDGLGRIMVDNGCLKIIGADKQVDLFYQQIFPARRGDRIVMEFTARGVGAGAAGAYFYSGRGDGAGRRLEQFEVVPETKKFKIEITTPNARLDRFTNGFRPVLAATSGAQVEYMQLKVYVVPRGNNP